MKIEINGKEVLTLSQIKKTVIQNDIPSEIFEEDMERRVVYVINHKYERCFSRLKQEWEPKLRDRGIEFIPTNDEAFAQLVFSQPDYKNRSERNATGEEI